MRNVLIVLVMLCVVCFVVSPGFGQVLPPEVPREDALILHYLFAPHPIPGNWNWWAGWRTQNCGLHQFVTDALWSLNPNVVEGGIIDALAAEPPIYNDDFTQLTIKLREGIYWSDGVEFTAHDVVFTILTSRDTPGIDFHGQMQDVEDAYAVDDYTVVVDLEKPNSRFHTAFLERWNALRPMPKHIFEQVDDVLAYEFHPPVSLGPYVYMAHDTAGYWVLWQKRDDWERTVTGKLFEEPKPEYVLFISPGPAETQIMAMLRHELDVVQGTAEQMLILVEQGDTTRGYRDTWPYIDPRDISTRGPSFNHLVFPYDNKEVRWALTLAIDIVEVSIFTYDGMVAMTPGLPLVVSQGFYDDYFVALEPWLEEFTLDLGDGRTFKPWDSEAPFRLLEWGQEEYEVDIDPEDEVAVRLTMGYGWWKYAPDVAEELLENQGFSRDQNDMWRLPDGSPWQITMVASPDTTDMGYIVAEGVAEQWKKFGIDVIFTPSPAHASLNLYGEFDVYATSHGSFAGEPWGLHPDLHRCFNALRCDFVKPVGEMTLGWGGRWCDPRVDEIVAELELTPWEDEERIIELGLDALKISIEEMVAVPLFNCPITIVFDEYYWTNWPSPENDYARSDNLTTWPQLKYILHQLEPTGRN